MKPDPMSAPEGSTGAVAQPVTAPLTRAAMFLVVTLNPGFDNRAALHSFCGDLAALVRAVEFRDLEAGLSCVVGFGSEAWERLFGSRCQRNCACFDKLALENATRFRRQGTCCSTSVRSAWICVSS